MVVEPISPCHKSFQNGTGKLASSDGNDYYKRVGLTA